MGQPENWVFAFARDLRRPEVRQRLTEVGFDGTQDAIRPGRPDEPPTIDSDARRILRVWPSNEPCGWSMVWEPTP